MKSGILGGTFDPPHRGHLEIAARVCAALALDRVFFVLSFQPPHKRSECLTPFPARWEMLRAALAGRPEFVPLDIEREWGGTSYTVRTVTELIRRNPADDFWLILGADSLDELSGWKDPERIAQLVRIAVYPRDGTAGEAPPFLKARVDRVCGPAFDVSSSEIRDRVRRGADVRDLVPPAVWSIIAARRLYHPSGYRPGDDGRAEGKGGPA